VAQVIRRFRDLDMPLDQVRAVLQAPDLETRTKEIISHLTAMEAKLAEMHMSVASLRALLEGPQTGPEAEFRSIPATLALAVRATVTAEEAWAWGAGAFEEIYGRLGTMVAERAIGVDGPIREYYLVPFTEPDLSRHRTEICWPVFQTA
jgi:DNA-binding transcriptional MerR regulator